MEKGTDSRLVREERMVWTEGLTQNLLFLQKSEEVVVPRVYEVNELTIIFLKNTGKKYKSTSIICNSFKVESNRTDMTFNEIRCCKEEHNF